MRERRETRLLVSKREVVLKWYQSGLNWYEVDPGLLASIWVIPNDLCMFPPILSWSVYFLATLSNILQPKVLKGVPWKSRIPGSGLRRELREKKKRTFQPIYNLSFIFFFITGVLFFMGVIPHKEVEDDPTWGCRKVKLFPCAVCCNDLP